MDWLQVITIIGSITALLIYFVQRLEGDINKLGREIETSNRRLDGHATRIDQLYKIFLETQQKNDQKFYELLKENKEK